jgi:hypothetical protein
MAIPYLCAYEMAAAVAQSNEIVKRLPNVGGAFVADSISISVEADAISRAAKTSRAASAAALGSQRSTRPDICDFSFIPATRNWPDMGPPFTMS